ncbi:MAG TPA: HAD-IA family hydrolase [Streptosporangiaceae bacterium]
MGAAEPRRARDAISVVVFDFDGLLMDTESTSLASWRYEWSQWGLTLDEGRFFVEHGGDVTEERYAELAAAVGPAYDRHLSHGRRTAYRDRLHRDLSLATGIPQWIEDASSRGLRLAVASSSPRSWVAGHLERVGAAGMFEVLACGDEVARHKPAPDVYVLALHRLGVDGNSAVAVEDTAHGVAAARAAGMRCIAIPNPFADRSRFGAAGLVLGSAAEMSLSRALASLSAA